MTYRHLLEKFSIDAKGLFIESALGEFLGFNLFDRQQRTYYQFSHDPRGGGVYLAQKPAARPDEEQYIIVSISENEKPQRAVQIFTFGHCDFVPGELFEGMRIEDVQKKFKQAGKSFGMKLNKAVTDVLLAAGSAKVQLQGRNVSEAMAELYSELVNDGFDPDLFLFPKHLEAKLVQQGIVVRDSEIHHIHYVGKTQSGQAAFRSNDLPKNVALLFDGSEGVILSKEMMKFELTPPQAFTQSFCANISINPIVKNTLAVVTLEGLDEALDQKTMELRQTPVIQYVSQTRIDELKALSSTNYDLSKLVRLCEEINLSFTSKCYFATVMLVRAILDHVPPIFGFPTFVQVANNYGEGGQSVKRSLQHLENSSRQIADSHLHQKIRQREALPNESQVYFSNDLDMLLAEVVRKLK